MKKLGVFCGLGPESTLEYYQKIIAAFKGTYQETGYPEIGLESCDLRKMTLLAEKGEWKTFAEEIAIRFENLRKGGAEIGAIASNTPHIVFNEIEEETQLPLISIVKATVFEVKNRKLKRTCLLGTPFTMRADFFTNELRKYGIEAIIPLESEISYIGEKLFSEIEHGIFHKETRQEIIKIIDRCANDEGADSVIMGCTELPLLIKEDDVAIEYIDTVKVHVEAIVQGMREIT